MHRNGAETLWIDLWTGFDAIIGDGVILFRTGSAEGEKQAGCKQKGKEPHRINLLTGSPEPLCAKVSARYGILFSQKLLTFVRLYYIIWTTIIQ